MNHNNFSTYLKGFIGTFPPFYALLFHIDVWAAPLQLCLGAIVPTLMGISLAFDIKRKWKENLEEERQAKIKDARRDYFKRKHYAKKNKIKADSTLDTNTPTDLLQ